jgi:hypothetical protein
MQLRRRFIQTTNVEQTLAPTGGRIAGCESTGKRSAENSRSGDHVPDDQVDQLVGPSPTDLT